MNQIVLNETLQPVKSMYADYLNGHIVFLKEKKILVKDKSTTQNSDFCVAPLQEGDFDKGQSC
jgi:hypothetical protein